MQIQRRHMQFTLAQTNRCYRDMTNCRAARIWVMLRCITLQVRDVSMIGCIVWANTDNTVCHLQTDASLPRDSSASVQSPPTHPLFFLEPRHTCTHTNTLTALSPNHWSQTGAKYRQWGRAIGSCQMRPHYQPLTVRLLCSSIITSHCTCLCAWPPLHTGTQVRLNIAIAPCCSAPHPPTPSFKPFIWRKLGTVARPAYRLTLSLSRLIPFYRNMMTLQWEEIINRDPLAPERSPSNIIPIWLECTWVYLWSARKHSSMSGRSL